MIAGIFGAFGSLLTLFSMYTQSIYIVAISCGLVSFLVMPSVPLFLEYACETVFPVFYNFKNINIKSIL